MTAAPANCAFVMRVLTAAITMNNLCLKDNVSRLFSNANHATDNQLHAFPAMPKNIMRTAEPKYIDNAACNLKGKIGMKPHQVVQSKAKPIAPATAATRV